MSYFIACLLGLIPSGLIVALAAWHAWGKPLRESRAVSFHAPLDAEWARAYEEALAELGDDPRLVAFPDTPIPRKPQARIERQNLNGCLVDSGCRELLESGHLQFPCSLGDLAAGEYVFSRQSVGRGSEFMCSHGTVWRASGGSSSTWWRSGTVKSWSSDA